MLTHLLHPHLMWRPSSSPCTPSEVLPRLPLFSPTVTLPCPQPSSLTWGCGLTAHLKLCKCVRGRSSTAPGTGELLLGQDRSQRSLYQQNKLSSANKPKFKCRLSSHARVTFSQVPIFCEHWGPANRDNYRAYKEAAQHVWTEVCTTTLLPSLISLEASGVGTTGLHGGEEAGTDLGCPWAGGVACLGLRCSATWRWGR